MPRHGRVARIVLLLLALVGAWLLFRPRSTGSDKLARPAVGDTVVVRVGFLPFVATLPYFVAESRGFFRDEGIVVRAEAASSSNQLVSALAAGQVDLVPALSAAPILALEAASPGRVAVISTSVVDSAHPFDALLVPGDSPVRTIADLRGRRIGVFPGTTASRLLTRWLAQQGIDTATVTLVPLPPAQQLGALQARRIDVLHAYEPTTTIATQDGRTRVLVASVYAALLSPNPQGVAVLSAVFAARHPASAAGVVRAMDRAFAWVAAYPDSARPLLEQRLGLPTDVARRVALPLMVPHATIDTVALHRYAALLHDIGELPRPVNTAALLWRGADR
jgi:ABC-type nitrate/sulfonate/bicarbonate transport system substrate-binding protein